MHMHTYTHICTYTRTHAHTHTHSHTHTQTHTHKRTHTHTGAPNLPSVSIVEPTSNNKDLLIEWTATQSELRPIDGYTGSIKACSSTTNKNKRDTTTENSEIITFRTLHKSYVYNDVDTSKVYEIIICAYNSFGITCGLSFAYTPDPDTTSESENEKDDGLEIWIVIILIVVAVQLLICCFLVLWLICYFRCCSRGKSYYPAEIGVYLFIIAQVNSVPSADSHSHILVVVELFCA